MERSETPVGEVSPPATVGAELGFSVGSVMGFAPAWRATSLTWLSCAGAGGAGVKKRNLRRKEKMLEMLFTLTTQLSHI
jgi:hypothetical protein